MSEKDGGSAFPESQTQYGGMTLRDYFAAQALIAIMATELSVEIVNRAGNDLGMGTRQAAAEIAYSLADEMLKARQK